MSSNSNSPTDPLRHNLKVNGIIAQNNTKSNMVYSPLALANNTNVNNNNNHITNNNSNADNSSGWWFNFFFLTIELHKKLYTKSDWKNSICLKYEYWQLLWNLMINQWNLSALTKFDQFLCGLVNLLLFLFFSPVQAIVIMSPPKIHRYAKQRFSFRKNFKIFQTIKCSFAKQKVILVSATEVFLLLIQVREIENIVRFFFLDEILFLQMISFLIS